jgi:hypothetical protein
MANIVSFNTGSFFPAASTGAGTSYSPDQVNTGCKGIKVGVSVTVDGGTGTLTVTIQGKDKASGLYYDILASTAVNIAAGLKVLTVYPSVAAAANAALSDALPATWRLKMVVANTVTATVGASLLV